MKNKKVIIAVSAVAGLALIGTIVQWKKFQKSMLSVYLNGGTEGSAGYDPKFLTNAGGKLIQNGEGKSMGIKISHFPFTGVAVIGGKSLGTEPTI